MKRIWEIIKAFVTDKTNQLLYLLGFGIAALLYILIVATQKWFWAMIIGAIISSAIIVAIAFYRKQNEKDKEKRKLKASDIVAGELGVLLLILASLINLG